MLQTGWSGSSESRCVSVCEKVNDVVKRVDRIEGSGERKEDDVSASRASECYAGKTGSCVGGQLQRALLPGKMAMAGCEEVGGWRRLGADPLTTHWQIARTPRYENRAPAKHGYPFACAIKHDSVPSHVFQHLVKSMSNATLTARITPTNTYIHSRRAANCMLLLKKQTAEPHLDLLITVFVDTLIQSKTSTAALSTEGGFRVRCSVISSLQRLRGVCARYEGQLKRLWNDPVMENRYQ